MSTFIELLRQHHQALEAHYSATLSNDMRKAIYAMLACKTPQQRQSLWACTHCEHHDRTPLSCGHRHCPQCQQNTTSQCSIRLTVIYRKLMKEKQEVEK